jgi:sugar lactone lactonase YvrE
MRRFLTLVCLLSLAIPAGVSISGCTRNPGANYCNGDGYGLKITDVSAIKLSPATTGISIAYGQTRKLSTPSAFTCKNSSADVTSYTYGTSNNKLVDIAPGGTICAGTWNRNTGGGVADYTVCSAPDPLPSTGGLPYATAYVTASAQNVTSNPVTVYLHPAVTSVSLVTTPTSGVAQQCYSQNTTATLDAQACYEGSDGTQVLLCAPSSVGTGVNKAACDMPNIAADIIASGSYVSGGSITGTEGETCTLSDFNNGSSGATATVTLTGANTIANGTALDITTGGTAATAAPTTARLSSGTATCSGTATVSTAVTRVPNCTASIGTLTYSVGTSNVASLLTNTSTNTVTITAGLPGTTTITASVADTGSSAGYFSTCPPASISLKLPSGATSETISQGQTENLTYTAYDTNVDACPATSANPKGGCAITGLSLDYQSTEPLEISVTSAGAITTTYPGEASIYAICQPSTCNPAPINEVGLYGTGLSVSSNPVTITTPGTTSDYVWFAAPGQSQYFASIDLLTGSVGSPIRLPYVPNSMLMDRTGNSLYFGSPHELMIYTAGTNALSSEITGVPGVLLAVSPDNAQLLINDQSRAGGVFYIYNISSKSATTFGGLGNAAAWSPDSKTLYITDNAALGGGHTDTLYVYNANTGWFVSGPTSSEPLPNSPLSSILPPGILPTTADQKITETSANVAISSTVQTPALTIPSVGAYLRGSPTVAHTWCPSGKVGTYSSMVFYPLADTVDDSSSVAVQSDALAATVDGQHVLAAAVTSTGATLSDIDVTIPKLNCLYQETDSGYSDNHTLAADKVLSPLPLTHTVTTLPLSGVSPTAINQVVASPKSDLAFITYTALETNTGATLPYYTPDSGTVGYVTLTAGSSPIHAPLAGAFSPDNKLFFVSTAGDNKIHSISVPTLTDTTQISPDLPACSSTTDSGCTFTGSGAVVPATAIVVKPRSTT